ncbi:MAG: DUF4249 family protein [Bacteroidales bacterium]|nr:DUF4249 family protein [Bacteroidales bacterium]MBN2818128.1 DUF4249 family protein [Bacteroidales bacterium]
MIHIRIIYISFIITAIASISCESTLQNFDIKNPEPKLVLNTFLGADSIPVLHVSRNLKISKTLKKDSLVNAEVLLYNGTEIIGNLNYKSEGWFENSEIKLNQGQHYTFVVKYSDYPEARADYYIPNIPVVSSIDTQLLKITDPDCIGCGMEYVLQITIDFENNNNEDEYFSVEVTSVAPDAGVMYFPGEGGITDTENDDTIMFTRWAEMETQAPFIEAVLDWGDRYSNVSQQDGGSNGTKFYFSDELLNAGANRLILKINIYSLTSYYYDVAELKEFSVHFKKIDKHLLEYAKSKGRNGKAEDNPFVEPVSIYTNVENGLGIVSGFADYKASYGGELITEMLEQMYSNTDY